MSDRSIYPPTEGKLYEAWRRARRRSICQDMGENPNDPQSVGAEYILRPSEMLPHERLAAVSLGRKLAREYKW